MKNKGTIIALALILVAGLGLYFSYLNKDMQGTSMPATSSSVPNEIWKTLPLPTRVTASPRITAATTPAPAKSNSTAAHNTVAPVQTKGPNSQYPYDYPGIAPAVAAVPKDPYLIFVSRDYALPANYTFRKAVCVESYPEKIEMEETAAARYREMYGAAKKDGAELIPYSGYRATSRQRSNFENKIAQYTKQGYSYAQAVNLAAESILPPGTSEHEAGLAIDITRPGVWSATESFANTKEFKWLQANAQDYGFILRYPKGKESVTKVKYEPWHWRYVGVENAKAVKASGKCLDEYLGFR